MAGRAAEITSVPIEWCSLGLVFLNAIMVQVVVVASVRMEMVKTLLGRSGPDANHCMLADHARRRYQL